MSHSASVLRVRTENGIPKLLAPRLRASCRHGVRPCVHAGSLISNRIVGCCGACFDVVLSLSASFLFLFLLLPFSASLVFACSRSLGLVFCLSLLALPLPTPLPWLLSSYLPSRRPHPHVILSSQFPFFSRILSCPLVVVFQMRSPRPFVFRLHFLCTYIVFVHPPSGSVGRRGWGHAAGKHINNEYPIHVSKIRTCARLAAVGKGQARS